MTLTAHAVFGTAAALVFRENPVAAFVAAFASHFAADAIPHWDYSIRSFTEHPSDYRKSSFTFGKQFRRDLFVSGLDCTLGFFASLAAAAALHPGYIRIALIGATGGVLPDFLQLMYYLMPRPFEKLQKFHWAIQKNNVLKKKYPLFGISSQAALVLAALAVISIA
ncbi:hypothetical protein C4587_00385 [Candidatus Parcubacteria bacterium]|nr:MAG: hypothetical protein C4587_00385 [Candidatus Parcubacteria bacterium]